jgi:septation ring formation regulator EzrA
MSYLLLGLLIIVVVAIVANLYVKYKMKDEDVFR